MAISVALNTPLADALNEVVQPKLVEVGWSTGGGDDSALAEYVILMLVNGKTQDQIATELANDLLSLGPEDTEAVEFSRWLFEQVEALDRQLSGPKEAAQQEQPPQAIPSFSSENSMGDADAPFKDQSVLQSDMEVEGGTGPGADAAVPTGPRNMRNQKRRGILGQLSRAMDRSHESVLHRVRNQQGTERVNSHRDGSKVGRGGRGGNRTPMGRQMGNVPMNMGMGMGMGMGAGMNHNPMQTLPQPNMNMTQQQQMQMMSMFEEQARMMSQLIPGFVAPAINPAFQNGPPQQPQGRSLFERAEFQPGRRPHGKPQPTPQATGDVEMEGVEAEGGNAKPGEEGNSRETNGSDVCRYNLRCTNRDCPYAHQSPAAPEGVSVDVNDICPYGAACKNRKCVARHPSPAQKAVHQSEEICRYFPHCANPKCAFKHPSMPLCRNGADCSTENCKFTHLQTPCRFNPCMNPTCQYKHAEGQRGAFGDKVWRADGASKGETPHVSERKFINETEEEELIKPGSTNSNDAGIIT